MESHEKTFQFARNKMDTLWRKITNPDCLAKLLIERVIKIRNENLTCYCDSTLQLLIHQPPIAHTFAPMAFQLMQEINSNVKFKDCIFYPVEYESSWIKGNLKRSSCVLHCFLQSLVMIATATDDDIVYLSRSGVLTCLPEIFKIHTTAIKTGPHDANEFLIGFIECLNSNCHGYNFEDLLQFIGRDGRARECDCGSIITPRPAADFSFCITLHAQEIGKASSYETPQPTADLVFEELSFVSRRCDNKNCKIVTEIDYRLNRAPWILAILLNRTKRENDGTVKKISTAYSIPASIALYVQDELVTYINPSIGRHLGSTPANGHYVAAINTMGCFIIADDLNMNQPNLQLLPTEVYDNDTFTRNWTCLIYTHKDYINKNKMEFNAHEQVGHSSRDMSLFQAGNEGFRDDKVMDEAPRKYLATDTLVCRNVSTNMVENEKLSLSLEELFTNDVQPFQFFDDDGSCSNDYDISTSYAGEKRLNSRPDSDDENLRKRAKYGESSYIDYGKCASGDSRLTSQNGSTSKAKLVTQNNANNSKSFNNTMKPPTLESNINELRKSIEDSPCDMSKKYTKHELDKMVKAHENQMAKLLDLRTLLQSLQKKLDDAESKLDKKWADIFLLTSSGTTTVKEPTERIPRRKFVKDILNENIAEMLSGVTFDDYFYAPDSHQENDKKKKDPAPLIGQSGSRNLVNKVASDTSTNTDDLNRDTVAHKANLTDQAFKSVSVPASDNTPVQPLQKSVQQNGLYRHRRKSR